MPSRRRRGPRIRPEERSLLARWSYWLGAGGTLADVRGQGIPTIQEIIDRERAARSAVPSVRMCWRWAYAAEWVDDRTGEYVESHRVGVETDREDQRQSAYAKARRLSLKVAAEEYGATEERRRNLRLTLRRIGRPIRVPCA